ncbi:MAG: Yop proteins translocation protein L [Candidatus Anoxychlamydiales bacterium]|nr:Yop proteins translocation protein L [Candidatus Anoxychlamydiales bacterium]
MKFFSFSNKEIHPQINEKIIDSKDFAQLLEIDDLLKEAKEDIKKQKLLCDKDCETLKKEAKKEGFNQGLDKFNKHILKIDKNLKEISKTIEKKIFTIALSAVKKIVGQELEIHPDRIIDIVKQALKPVLQHKKIKIYVNKLDLEILEKEKQKIKDILDSIEYFLIQERDDIQRGGCIIETEAGIINAQLENQFRAIEAAFESFKKK